MKQKRKWLSVLGIILLLASGALSTAMAPNDASAVAAVRHQRPPIQYRQTSAPVDSQKPGKSGGSTRVVYTPTNIQSAYDFGAFANGGAGQAIAIIDAYGDPTLSNDIAVFDNKFGLSAANVNVIYVDYPPSGSNSNWAMETALDVEWSHANAPAATIDLVVTPDDSLQHMLDGVNYAVNNLNVAAISMSWGSPEVYLTSSQLSAYEAAFAAGYSKGIVMIAASGDQGAYDGTRPHHLTVDYPSSSPEVIGVGGTTLTLNNSGDYGSESAWSGSGGGYSSVYAEPAYQTAASIYDPSGKRGVPDVSFDANPNTGVYVYAGGSWYAVGGTSVGAPCWAAIVADNAANNATASSPHPLSSNYLYGTVYGVSGASALYAGEMHDVTSGNNGYYSAGLGWDAVTGIGSPNVAKLISATP